MGHWGVRSYENDEASDAIDAGFQKVHGFAYESLMDDGNPLTYDQVLQTLANFETLTSAIDSLKEERGRDRPFEEWDETDRLACAGVVVRHAEFGVPIAVEWLDRAIDWLENESIEWDEATVRRLHRQKEIALLRSLKEHANRG
ncbi:MAG: hypothetical protein NVSMB9_19390 [Isosphaeraceae bacterium]